VTVTTDPERLAIEANFKNPPFDYGVGWSPRDGFYLIATPEPPPLPEAPSRKACTILDLRPQKRSSPHPTGTAWIEGLSRSWGRKRAPIFAPLRAQVRREPAVGDEIN
jgi:hypothetical protein